MLYLKRNNGDFFSHRPLRSADHSGDNTGCEVADELFIFTACGHAPYAASDSSTLTSHIPAGTNIGRFSKSRV